ncbi:ATP-binding cassette domain-containing protein [Tyzzerella sp. OttesenSCG-928-J15]|nr:ATP-binding cassette domain-containing protein [Tyzzerella sp. OttesenSCG-928-J15]
MSKQAQIDIQQAGSAVRAENLSKTFIQSTRENEPGKVLKSLFKSHKRVITALDNVSFTVEKGEFVAYAGPNGAGKSTTMKILCGMLMPTEGSARVLGMSPEKMRIELMKKVGVLFGNRTELWWDHPVSQSFEWKKVVWDIDEKVYNENVEMVKALFGLEDIMNTFARELSLGQRMRADIALMLLHSPEIIFLDEPTLGLDVVAKRQLIDALKILNKEKGVTIMVTSHDMDDLEEMARRIFMISKGKLAFDGSFDELRNVAGSVSKVSIATFGKAEPVIDGGKLLSATGGVYDFEVDLSKISVKNLLHQISKFDDVKNVEIKKVPIEQVITRLYEKWA